MRPNTIVTKLGAMIRLLGVSRFLWLVGLGVTLPVQGCIHDILSVTDPDIVSEETLRANTAVGAMALHNGTIFASPRPRRGPGSGGGARPCFRFVGPPPTR